MIELQLAAGDAEQRVDRYIRKEFEDVPMGQIAKLFRKKKVRINGVRAKAEDRVQANDIIQIYENLESQSHIDKRNAAQETRIDSQNNVDGWGGVKSLKKSSQIEIAYDDDDIIIVNKRAGVPVHPGSGQAEGVSLIEKVWEIMKVHPDARFKPQLVHRLDKGTSGLVVIALKGKSLKSWNEKFRDRQLIKKYQTLVSGHVEDNKGEIELELERQDSKAGGAKVKVVSKSTSQTQKSFTRYKVLKRFNKRTSDSACTLVEVDLGTGRMHQIRTHFEFIGHPLLGDDRYGDFEKNRHFKKEYGLKRMFLHSFKLSWGEGKTEAELPEELQVVLDQLNS